MIPLMRKVAMIILIPQMMAAPLISSKPIGCPRTAQSRKQPNGMHRYMMICTTPTVLYSIDFAMAACWTKAMQASPNVAR